MGVIMYHTSPDLRRHPGQAFRPCFQSSTGRSFQACDSSTDGHTENKQAVCYN